jgi:pilus assembly protein CpaB
VVTFEMISSRPVPSQFVTSSVVKPDAASYVVNQKVLVPLQRGDPLLWSQFETTKAAERLSTKIQKKTRAVTVDANGKKAVGGWVRPNDHVDLIGTFKDPDSGELVAVTLLQNVNLVKENDREYRDVSLLVIPEEAEILVLASELGDLSMVLRNEDDVDVLEERGRATIKTLLSGERTRAMQEKRNAVITIIRGSSDKGAVGGALPTP